MSIVIVGGNERMERQYVDICQKYKHKVKTFIKPVARLKNKIGEPDLMIFFTNCMSHKMVHCALDEIKGMDTRVERVQSASVASLKKILEKYAAAAVYPFYYPHRLLYLLCFPLQKSQ